MEESNKREFSRILKNLTITIVSCDQYKHDGLWVTLTCVDLSKTGILFESPNAYKIGERYIIRFSGKSNKFYDESIEIIRVEEIVTGTQYLIGAKFIDTTNDIIQKLTQ